MEKTTVEALLYVPACKLTFLRPLLAVRFYDRGTLQNALIGGNWMIKETE